jgi:hypothetical protein
MMCLTVRRRRGPEKIIHRAARALQRVARHPLKMAGTLRPESRVVQGHIGDFRGNFR